MAIQVRDITALLEVYDMPRAVQFYRNVLGFELVETSRPPDQPFDWCMLRHGGSLLMLNTRYDSERRPPRPQHRPSLEDVTLFIGCDDVDLVYEHLRSRSWPASEPTTAHYGMRQVFLRDPDGFKLCFQHPDRSRQAAHASLRA
jgi:glyoxylase I family protein